MLQADSDEMYQSWISAMQQGIGAAIQLSISEENSLVPQNLCNSVNIGGKESGASHSPSGSSTGDPAEKPSPERQRKNKYVYYIVFLFSGTDVTDVYASI